MKRRRPAALGAYWICSAFSVAACNASSTTAAYERSKDTPMKIKQLPGFRGFRSSILDAKMSAVNAISSSGVVGILRCVDR